MTTITILDKINPSEKQIKRLMNLVGKNNLCLFHELPNPSGNEEIISRIGESEIVLTSWTDFPVGLINILHNVKLLSVVATGYSWVDVEAASKAGITVTNVPGYAEHAVSELVFGFILNFYRDICHYSSQTKLLDYSRNKQPGDSLFGKTIGIIGTGTIGSHVAEIGHGFGMNVIGYTKHPSPERGKLINVEFVDLKTLLTQSDIVTIHVPKNQETIGMIGKREFSMMKDGALFICTTESDVFDPISLLDSLETGKLLGAGIDKPLAKDSEVGKKLAQSSKVIMTPEIGFFTAEAFERLVDISIDNIESFLKGHPQNVVSK